MQCTLQSRSLTQKERNKSREGKPCLIISLARSSRTRVTPPHSSHQPHKTKIKHSHVHCQRLNKLPFFMSDVRFVRGTWDAGVGEITSFPSFRPRMRRRQFRPCSVYEHLSRDKWNVSQAPVHRCFFPQWGAEMLSGDAAPLFPAYSGCTGNILSFYPSTSPRSISDPPPDY